MLQLRPNCECCDTDLPADSVHARICSFECTFCATCANAVLNGICPNCGGELVPRPRRRNRVRSELVVDIGDRYVMDDFLMAKSLVDLQPAPDASPR